MNNILNTTKNSQTAGLNGKEQGQVNEITLLNCIKSQGWIREYEAAILTGISHQMVGIISRRLAKKGQIFRIQSKNKSQINMVSKMNNHHQSSDGKKTREVLQGNAGFFLRLSASGAARVKAKTGKDIPVTAQWKHHSLALQTLSFLASHNKCCFLTEAQMRPTIKRGKIPDGQLLSDTDSYHFEQELSEKGGKNLAKQTEHICKLADSGTTCYIAYPYPADIAGGIDHETRLINSIRLRWGSPDAPNIKLIRCHFTSCKTFMNMHASNFEIIDLPQLVKTLSSQKLKRGMTDQIAGYQWITSEKKSCFGVTTTSAVLSYQKCKILDCEFIEGRTIDEQHILNCDDLSFWCDSVDSEQNYYDFISEKMKIIEKMVDKIGAPLIK